MGANRDKKSRSGKSKAGDLRGIDALVSQVFEISLQRAGEPGASGFQAECLAYALGGSQLEAAGTSWHAHLAGLHQRGRCLQRGCHFFPSSLLCYECVEESLPTTLQTIEEREAEFDMWRRENGRGPNDLVALASVR